MAEEALTGIMKQVYDYVVSKSPEKISRATIAKDLGISYFAARYRLDRLVEMGRIDVEKTYTLFGFTSRVWYYPVLKTIHYVVAGNVETRDEYTTLSASCTLDYDVKVDKDIEEKYYKKATTKIYDWVSDMFNERSVKFSSETSKTDSKVNEEMIKSGVEVTDIDWDWWWARTGRTSNKESDAGTIGWDDPIPVGVSGGWMTSGRRKGGKYVGRIEI